ncbi:MAG: DUF2817 domain-containing protein [Armatimonadetes bacterium]|nr:DUF2817 domain-containing protein [Armatimonadota bacterium]
MHFSSFRRTARSRAFLWCGAGLLSVLSASEVRAQQLSPLAAPALEPPAPLEEQQEEDDAPFARVRRPARITRPALIVRGVPISAPPDGFYQTPEEIEPWLLDLSRLRPTQVKTRILGATLGGNRIVALEITPSGVSPWKLRRLAVLCRQHGNEPESSASGARFIREFLTSSEPKKRAVAQKTALLIVPIANPDGAALYRRRTEENIDMNRDWGPFRTQETRVLANWIGAWRPHLIVDVHQWLPKDRQNEPMAEASGGALARRTAARMAQNSARRGYALSARSRWGLDTLSHRFWGQKFKIPAILLETRHRPGVAGAREAAIGTSLAALWGAAETVSRK